MNPLEMYTEIAINFVIWIIFGGRLKSMFPTKTTHIYRSPCTGLQSVFFTMEKKKVSPLRS